MSFWLRVKKKFPATFNAAEYETERLLSAIEQLDASLRLQEDRLAARQKTLENQLLQIQHELGTYQNELEERLDELKEKRAADWKKSREELQQMVQGFVARQKELEKQLQEISQEQETYQEKLGKQLQQRENVESEHRTELIEQFQKFEQDQVALMKGIKESSLFSIIKCKSDRQFDEKLIPLNNFFKGHGMAISMHLTSVDGLLDDVVYQTADLVRASALSLVVDEIKRRELSGAVAELGVAEGKFSSIINALLPDKRLYLFDTFEGFPDADLVYEVENNYSNAKAGTYAGIDLKKVMEKMRTPENCVIRKGWFPDTSVGLEEQFCFVSIDCDLYQPIYAGLSYFYPRLVKYGYIFVHDYRSKYYRGVKAALTRFADEYGISYSVLPDNTGTAVITK